MVAVHEERAAIARELRDLVAHSVSVMLVGVRGARDVLRTAPYAADDTLARVERSGEQSLAELRRILVLLREREQTAQSHPQPSLAELDELVARYREAGLPVRLELIGEPMPLPSGVELSVYRIVQEALTNALKHSDPTRVTVTLTFRYARLDLEVVDDGTPTLAAASTGHASSACANASHFSAASSRPGSERAAASVSRRNSRWAVKREHPAADRRRLRARPDRLPAVPEDARRPRGRRRCGDGAEAIERAMSCGPTSSRWTSACLGWTGSRRPLG